MSGRRRVVFLIDGDESSRVTHETILRNEGYEILSAADGAQALSQIREQPPDLLMVGQKIGRMSVAQLIRMVKLDPALAATRVCAYAPEPSREELLAAGADAALAAPVATGDLVREVVALIGRA